MIVFRSSIYSRRNTRVFILYVVFPRKADQLKEQICASRDINSVETLACQQQLRVCDASTTVAQCVSIYCFCLVQIIYQQVLTLDLEYALDQKVEQDLWNHGFKNNINKLQQLTKDKKVFTRRLIEFTIAVL